jgi:iron-sulfur cluster repair protein YtfE (RIC family)
MIDAVAGSLAAALEREHNEIDDGIARFRSGQDREPLRRSVAALRRHIYLEEEFVFPALRADGDAGLVAPIFVMLREHGQLWRTLEDLERELDTATTDGTLLCHQLLVALQHHNLKEERILYPAADRTLSPAAVARLIEFLGSADLPDGWVCVKARA